MLRSSKLYVCIYAGNVNSLSNNQKQIENEKKINKYVTNMKMTCINKNQFIKIKLTQYQYLRH